MKNLFKYASLLIAAVMLFSCSGTVDPEQVKPEVPGNTEKPGPVKPKDLALVIATDRNVIQANVDVATLSVSLTNGVDTEEIAIEDVVFYDGDNNPLDLPDLKFTAKKAGEYVIWANYGTYESNEITIKALDIPVPATPADPEPASTDFKAKVLMMEFTTTGCSYCPNMKLLLHNALEDASVADKVVLTACHSGLVGSKPDPAYIRTTIDDFCAITGFPSVNFDLYHSFNNYNVGKSEMQTMINDFHSSKEDEAAGIAVNSILDGGKLTFKATVKAAVEGEYRVGALLLEDGIYAVQSGGSAQEWMNTHDGVVRYIDSKYSNASGKEQYFGHLVGKIAKGKTADCVFDWDLDKIWSDGTYNGELYGGVPWSEFVMDNLHLVVFVSTMTTDDKGNQYYYVNNVIDCPVNGMTPYEYR